VAERTTAIFQTCACPFVSTFKSTAYILALLFLQAAVKGYKRLHTSVVHIYTVLPKMNVYVSHITKYLFKHWLQVMHCMQVLRKYWWRGIVANAFRLKRSYSTPGPVSTAMSDCLRAGKPSRCEACQLGQLSLLLSVGW